MGNTASFAPQKNTDYPKDCKLIIVNQQHTYRKFRAKASVEAVRVIKFEMKATNHKLTSCVNQYLFAWSRAVVGEPIYSLPADYISACLYLPLIFYLRLKINIRESEEGCLIKVKKCDHCVRKIIFESLIDFTRVDNCDNVTCDTICSKNDSMSFDPIKRGYSCCSDEDLRSNSTSIKSCLNNDRQHIFYQLDIVITTASILALIPTYIYIARTLVCWKGR